MSGRGRLIVVEGLDGVGKTTASRRLAEVLGARWETTPGAALRNGDTRAAYRTAEGLVLFYASAVIDAGHDFEELLASGQDVVCDRYWLSTVSGATARGAAVPLDELEALVLPADATFVLTAGDAARAERLSRRDTFTSEDRASLDGRWSATVLGVLRAQAHGRIAGTTHEIDTTDVGVDQVVDAMLAELGGRRDAAASGTYPTAAAFARAVGRAIEPREQRGR